MGRGAIINSIENPVAVQDIPSNVHRRSLLVGIDSGPLLGQGGISEYVRPLICALLKMDQTSQYTLSLRRSWVSESSVSMLETLAPVVTCHVPDRALSWWWSHLGTPFPMNGDLWKTVDLFLATCLMAPILAKGKVISVMYDLIPLRLPHLFPEHQRFKVQVEEVVDRSEALIAISQQTKQDLIEILGIDDRKIHVILPGRGDIFRPATDSEIHDTMQRYGIKGPYILYVGATGPHKNVENLLRAYREACLNGGLALSLVLVLRAGISDAVQRMVNSLSQGIDLYCLHNVHREDLPGLYSGATFFVWPSRYEGFGLPVLESMACGTPVLLGPQGVSREIVKEYGCYVDVESPVKMAEGICAFAKDHERRQRLSIQCQERAESFSWKRSAEQLRSLLYAVI